MQKRKPVRSKALRDSARGERCTLRLPEICCHDTATTVLAHLRSLSNTGGMGSKPDDFGSTVYACHACHDAIDGRTRTDLSPAELGMEEGRALCETIARMVDKGLVRIEGHDRD